MALSGEVKEMRSMPSSLGYDSLETLDHHSRPPPHIQGGGSYGGGGTLINSGGSKSRTAPLSSMPRTTSTTRYRECLKNHAAATGGKITDGCGEFMPSGEDGTLESFKCAACHCHRNFHRKEYSDNRGALVVHPLQLSPALPSPSAVHSNHHHQWATTMVQPVKMAFGGGGGGSASAATDSSSEELNFNTYQSTSAPPPPPQFVLAKKRFRTKFSQDQKEKMLAFAEKLGWRIPREDDTEMQRFCGEVGVKRQVFKVWMHNNKNSSSHNKTLQES